MSSEAQARILINRLLEAAGWRLTHADRLRANVLCEHRIGRKSLPLGAELGNDFEHAPSGFVDYLLLNTDLRPVAVVEAKRESIDPLTAKEQARDYARSLGVRHVFLSNGRVHYYWNLDSGNPVRIGKLLTLDELGKASEWCPDPQRLAALPVDENYIAVSQDAGWLGYSAADRALVQTNKKIRQLRDYQVAAVHALQKSASPTRNRFLFEMATGTGKTLLSAAIAKLYLRSENATRILFLVDRLELENQAWKNFNAYLGPDGIQTIIYKQNRQDWMKAQVVITTIQSLAARERYLTEFAPTDFQLIISDEAHRTISGSNRTIFEYFVGAKLGLTATPRDYLKGLEDDDQDDPAAMEKRLLLDTYSTFGCGDGRATFRYSLLDAVQHDPPYLCNPVALDARTDITTRLLSKEGYVVTKVDEGGDEQEITFNKSDFERRFTSRETNLSFIRCFLEHARRDPLTGEIGKTIFFAVSRKHATKLVTLLNEEATRLWPDAYGAGSSFAVQVTSDVTGAQQMTINFANNNLNGKSKWRSGEFRDYDTSRTRVCVTVGMMTTGYDCEDLLNVVLARPIFSPTDFIQIKGRGTRLWTFTHGEGAAKRSAEKTGFALFDFFANCEYFETEFDYDEKLKLPVVYEEGGGGDPPKEHHSNTSPDPLATVVREEIGQEGMRIDREMYRDRFAEQAQQVMASDLFLKDAFEKGDWSGIEDHVRRLLFDQPDEFWDLGKLQTMYQTDRKPTLREILAVVFGVAKSVPTRTQLAEQAFERFTATLEHAAVHSVELRVVFEAFLLDAECRVLLEEGKFAELKSWDARLYESISRLSPEERESVIRYLRANVSLGDFDLAM